MLKDIEEGRIYKVVVYSRDRLARNVYEYMHIVKVFLKHKVEVIFSNGATPFTYDLTIESFLGLLAQMEGQNINRRVKEILSRYPNQMIGYHNIKNKDGKTERYEVKGNWESYELFQLFTEVSNLNDVLDLYHLVTKYRKLLNRDGDRIISILRTPFFAAKHLNHLGVYEDLSYVDPIISFDLYLKVKEKLDFIEQEFTKGKRTEKNKGNYTPVCNICGQIMRFKPGTHGNSGVYKCKKHSSILIPVPELEDAIQQGITKFLKELGIAKMENSVLESVNVLLQKEFEKEMEITASIKSLGLKITVNYSPLDSSKELQELFTSLSKMREESTEIKKQIVGLQFVTKDIKSLIYIFNKHLEDGKIVNRQNLLFIADSVIRKILIDKHTVVLDIYFNEFLKEDKKKGV